MRIARLYNAERNPDKRSITTALHVFHNNKRSCPRREKDGEKDERPLDRDDLPELFDIMTFTSREDRRRVDRGRF